MTHDQHDSTAAPGMVEIRRDDLEHLLDWHNKPCGEPEDEGMFARLLAVLHPYTGEDDDR